MRRRFARRPARPRRSSLSRCSRNTATAAALAALYQRLVQKKLARMDEATMTAIRALLDRGETAGLGQRYDKGGALASDPLTQVKAGWWETAKGPVVFVVMLVQPDPGPERREKAIAAQAKAASDLADKAVRTADRKSTRLNSSHAK